MDTQTDNLVKERGKKYGENTLAITGQLSEPIPKLSKSNGGAITAITLILCKVARAISGDPFYDDNPKDIKGYMKIMEIDKIDMFPDNDFNVVEARENILLEIQSKYPLSIFRRDDEELYKVIEVIENIVQSVYSLFNVHLFPIAFHNILEQCDIWLRLCKEFNNEINT